MILDCMPIQRCLACGCELPEKSEAYCRFCLQRKWEEYDYRQAKLSAHIATEAVQELSVDPDQLRTINGLLRVARWLLHKGNQTASEAAYGIIDGIIEQTQKYERRKTTATNPTPTTAGGTSPADGADATLQPSG